MNPWQRWRQRTSLGWIQLCHDKTRLAVSLLGVAVTSLLMFMTLGIMQTNLSGATVVHQVLAGEIIMVNQAALELVNLSTFPRRRLLQAQAVAGVERALPLYVATAPWTHPLDGNQGTLLVLGLQPGESALLLPELAHQSEALRYPDRLLLDRRTRTDVASLQQRLTQGQPVGAEMLGQRMRVAGFFTLGTPFGLHGHLILGTPAFARLFPDRSPSQVSLGVIRLQPGYPPEQVLENLRRALPHDIKLWQRADFAAFELEQMNRRAPMAMIFGTMTMVGFVVGAAVVYQILATDVQDHLPEYATFKAMGYSQGFLLAIVFEQALILAGLGLIPGILLAEGLYAMIRASVGIGIAMTGQRLLLVGGATLSMCLGSGFLATRKLAKIDPAEVFA